MLCHSPAASRLAFALHYWLIVSCPTYSGVKDTSLNAHFTPGHFAQHTLRGAHFATVTLLTFLKTQKIQISVV